MSTEMYNGGSINHTYLRQYPNYISFSYPPICITNMRNLITFVDVRSAFVLNSRNQKVYTRIPMKLFSFYENIKFFFFLNKYSIPILYVDISVCFK